MTSLQAAICAQVERAPERDALTVLDGTAPHTLSRGQLHRAALRRAAALQAHGLRPGEVCVLALPSDATCTLLLLGVLLAGGVPVLVAPPTLRSHHQTLVVTLAHTITCTDARLVVLPEDLRSPVGSALTGAARRVVSPGELDAAETAAVAVAQPSADTIAALQLTSGTTGLPRICVWSHAQVLAAVDAMAAAMQLGDDDRMLSWVPLYHDMGLVNNLLLCLVRGVPLATLTPSTFIRQPARWLRGLSEQRATHSWAPNFGFAVAAQRIRDQQLEGVRLDHVRGLWNAAERIHAATLQTFHRRFAPLGLGWRALRTNFGCAEHVGGATFSGPDHGPVVEHVDARSLHEQREAVPVAAETSGTVAVVSVGRPAPGGHVDILAADGARVPDGRVGELGLRSASCMLGYLQPDGSVLATAMPMRTGDLGYRRGDEVFWVGRARETIVIRGRKLDPSDFERVLLTAPGVRPGCFAVFGIDDEQRGTERLVIVSELRAGEHAPGVAKTIREQVEQQLGLAVDELLLVAPGTLTKTSSGKRRHLFWRDRYLRDELPAAIQT